MPISLQDGERGDVGAFFQATKPQAAGCCRCSLRSRSALIPSGALCCSCPKAVAEASIRGCPGRSGWSLPSDRGHVRRRRHSSGRLRHTIAACLEQAFGNLAFRSRARSRTLAVFYERKLVTDPARGARTAIESSTLRSARHRCERFHGNVAKTFAQGSSLCVSGYYHGILERAFLGITTRPELGAQGAGACASRTASAGESFLDYQCRHGLGHGLHDPDVATTCPWLCDICAGARDGLGPQGVREWRVHGEHQHARSVSGRRGSTTRSRCTRAPACRSSTSGRATCARAGGSSCSRTGRSRRPLRDAPSSADGRRPACRDSAETSPSMPATCPSRSGRCVRLQVHGRAIACAAPLARSRTLRDGRVSRAHVHSAHTRRVDSARTASPASASWSGCSIRRRRHGSGRALVSPRRTGAAVPMQPRPRSIRAAPEPGAEPFPFARIPRQ